MNLGDREAPMEVEGQPSTSIKIAAATYYDSIGMLTVLREIAAAIGKSPKKSRALSLVATKVDEARHWLQEAQATGTWND